MDVPYSRQRFERPAQFKSDPTFHSCKMSPAVNPPQQPQPVMNNGGKDTSNSDVQRLQEQLNDIKEQVTSIFVFFSMRYGGFLPKQTAYFPNKHLYKTGHQPCRIFLISILNRYIFPASFKVVAEMQLIIQ